VSYAFARRANRLFMALAPMPPLRETQTEGEAKNIKERPRGWRNAGFDTACRRAPPPGQRHDRAN